jgi:hypothetical protein
MSDGCRTTLEDMEKQLQNAADEFFKIAEACTRLSNALMVRVKNLKEKSSEELNVKIEV